MFEDERTPRFNTRVIRSPSEINNAAHRDNQLKTKQGILFPIAAISLDRLSRLYHPVGIMTSVFGTPLPLTDMSLEKSGSAIYIHPPACSSKIYFGKRNAHVEGRANITPKWQVSLPNNSVL